VLKYYPSYLAYESYAEQVEKMIEGKNAINHEQKTKISEQNIEIEVLGSKIQTWQIIAGVGIPAAGLISFLLTFFISR